MAHRLSIGGRKIDSKKSQLKAIENDARRLKEEIQKYNGSRNDRRYSEIQAHIIRKSFEVDNIRKSFRKKKDQKEIIKCQKALSTCIQQMEEKVEANEINSSCNVCTTYLTETQEDSLAFINRMENRVRVLNNEIEQIQDTQALNLLEKEVLILIRELENTDVTANRSAEQLKIFLKSVLTNCRSKIIIKKYKILQMSSDDGEFVDVMDLHRLFEGYESVRDKFGELELEIFKFLQKKGKPSDDRGEVRPEKFQRMIVELQIISLRMQKLKKALKKW